MIVVFSAGIGYLFALPGPIQWGSFLLFVLGGFLVTASANALNEIIEKDLDRLMKRTALRPLPAGRMAVPEATLVAGLFGVAGIFVLGYFFNYLAGMLGGASLLAYAFIYTPLKRISSIAVFVGAIPGAFPPVIGWAAATGQISGVALLLFAIQFLWQFPHFWAVAWLAFEDYKAAGFRLLPSGTGKSRISAFYNILYIATLMAVTSMPYLMGISGVISLVIVLLAGVGFLWPAIRLYWSVADKDARSLMYASFLYLPVVFIALILDKI